MPDEETPNPYCYACGYLRSAKNAKIPRVRYHDKDEEEPKQPYIAGYKKCSDICHPKKGAKNEIEEDSIHA